MIALTITGIKVGRLDSYDHRLYGFNAEWIDLKNVGDQPIAFDFYLRIKTSTTLKGAAFDLRAGDPRTRKPLELAPQTGFRLLSGTNSRAQNLPEGFQAYYLNADRFVLHPAGELIAIFQSHADCLQNRLPLAQLVYGNPDRTVEVESQLRHAAQYWTLYLPRYRNDQMPGFPTECLDCSHRDESDYARCYECVKHRIHPLPDNCCPKCSHPLFDNHCPSHGCRQGLNRFSKAYAVGPLTGLLSGGISRLKDAREKRMAAPLGKLLAGYMLENEYTFADYDFFLPIPKHPDRVAARGFDQVKAIYREACRSLVGHMRYDDLKISPYLIQNKVVKSLRRDTHSAAERFQEVSACFSLSFDTPIFKGMRILVFDDVMTSGATMSAAAEALLDAGAVSVDGIVLARKLLDAPGSDSRY